MKSREDVLKALREARPRLQARFPISRIALFGSYARGEQRADSNVDILVEVDPSIGLRFSALAEELEKLPEKRVELVSSRAISPRMRPLIEADCIEVAWNRQAPRRRDISVPQGGSQSPYAYVDSQTGECTAVTSAKDPAVVPAGSNIQKSEIGGGGAISW